MANYGRHSAWLVSSLWDDVHDGSSMKFEALEASVWANVQMRKRESWTGERTKVLLR